ncbi:protein petR [Azospira sp. I13]|uniref:response regulator transcription factor n=1 Tax=Azospira sp. I13 TaxID=1765050 RepID=UPI000D406ABB|nr:response regulator transcription factor [Azospira sp. I13]GBG04071.1 protein petR [Azospira sp. I13]
MDAAVRRLEICVVEDEEDLREEIVGALQDAGFGVRGFPGSRELYASLLATPCNIVILDIGLPGEDGFSIAERLHGLGSMGIIMLTARGQTEDRVRALMGGADAYMVKPVDLRELLAVIGSLARRMQFGSVTESGVAGQDNVARAWAMSADGWTLFDPEGNSIPLTSQERAFLQCLWQRAGEAVSREDLAVAMGGDPYEYDFHRLDTLVSRLRRKAADAGLALPLRAVRGTGYLFLPVSVPVSEPFQERA